MPLTKKKGGTLRRRGRSTSPLGVSDDAEGIQPLHMPWLVNVTILGGAGRLIQLILLTAWQKRTMLIRGFKNVELLLCGGRLSMVDGGKVVYLQVM